MRNSCNRRDKDAPGGGVFIKREDPVPGEGPAGGVLKARGGLLGPLFAA